MPTEPYRFNLFSNFKAAARITVRIILRILLFLAQQKKYENNPDIELATPAPNFQLQVKANISTLLRPWPKRTALQAISLAHNLFFCEYHRLLSIVMLVLGLSSQIILSGNLFSAETRQRKIGLALPGILFQYNGSAMDQLSSLKTENFTVADIVTTLGQQWQVNSREQLLEQLLLIGNDGASRSYRYLHKIVNDYAAALRPSSPATTAALMQLFQASDQQSLELVEKLRQLYPDLDPYDLRRLYLMVNMKFYFNILPDQLRGWDMARLVALARWGYDLGYLSEEEAWRYIDFAGNYVLQHFSSWDSYVENYIYGRLFEYASLPQAALLLRDSVLLWWQLIDHGGSWEGLTLSVYEQSGRSQLLELFRDLYNFQKAIRSANIEALQALLQRKDQLKIPLLTPANSPLYLALDQPDAHRRSALSLAVNNTEILNLLLTNGFRYNSSDEAGHDALYWAIVAGDYGSTQTLLPRSRYQRDRSGRGPLHWASLNGNASLVASLLQAGFQVNSLDNEGNSPLHLAAQYSGVNSSRFLLEASATKLINQGNFYQQTPLHLALLNQQDGNLAALLLQQYRNEIRINLQDAQGLSPLMIAAQPGKADVLLLLLEAGADTRLQDASGWTALHHAANNNSINALRLLLQYNRDIINRQSSGGVTALMLAARHSDGQLTSLLLEAGADPLIADKQQRLALHYAAEASLANVKTILSYGVAIGSTDQLGWTALQHSIANNQIDITTYLLDSDILDSDQQTSINPLLEAVRQDNYAMVKLLLERRVALQANDKDTTVSLAGAAAQLASYRILWTLGEAGADLEQKNDAGDTPLHLASHFGSAEMLSYLLRRGSDAQQLNDAGQSPLQLAAQDLVAGAEKIRLLASSSNLEAISKEGLSALSYAAQAGNFAAARALLNAGAEVDNNQSSWPALAAAAAAASPDIMLLLLDRNADINAVTRPQGNSALHYTVASRSNIFWTVEQRLQMTQRLIDDGALMNVADQRGNTALFWAALQGDAQLTTLLLKHGANPYLHNRDQLGPLQFAIENSYENCYQLLRFAGSSDLKRLDGSGLLAIERAAQLGDRHTLNLLLSLGAEVNALGQKGYRPLFFALHAQDLGNINTLLRAGAKAELAAKDGEGLLAYALRSGAASANIMVLLDSVSANQVIDEQGDTALHLAVADGRSELISPLIRAGNPINAINNNGDTALHLAVKENDLSSSKMLLAAGANPQIINQQQLSPLGMALEGAKEQLLELFQHYEDQG